ncbi:hypothetical protein BD779DRAFT_1561560, partial [Infundibulicybe gibba]
THSFPHLVAAPHPCCPHPTLVARILPLSPASCPCRSHPALITRTLPSPPEACPVPLFSLTSRPCHLHPTLIACTPHRPCHLYPTLITRIPPSSPAPHLHRLQPALVAHIPPLLLASHPHRLHPALPLLPASYPRRLHPSPLSCHRPLPLSRTSAHPLSFFAPSRVPLFLFPRLYYIFPIVLLY